MNSILKTIKKLLGIGAEYEHFDQDIVMHINTVLMTLTQLGVGPSEGFSIEDDTSEWTDFIQDTVKIEAVKSYVFLKVKLLFDPPASSVVVEAMNRSIDECEWRIKLAVEEAAKTQDQEET